MLSEGMDNKCLKLKGGHVSIQSVLLWGIPLPKEEVGDGRQVLRILVIQMAKATFVGAMVFLGGVIILSPSSALTLGLGVTTTLGMIGMVVID